MNFLIGFFVAVAGLIAASSHLDQGPKDFWDFLVLS